MVSHKFILQSGLFGKSQELAITADTISFEGIQIDTNTFVDVKYKSEHIVWYKFYVGVEFRIDIKYEGSKILALKFSKYAWKNRHYSQMYSDISNYVGNYFLIHRINDRLEQLDKTGVLGLHGLKITNDSISLNFSNPSIPLTKINLKEYASYFVVFDKTNPTIHKRISFDDWNAELLFNVIKNLIRN